MTLKSASERRGNNLKGFQDFDLEALFDVYVELSVSTIALSPSLDDSSNSSGHLNCSIPRRIVEGSSNSSGVLNSSGALLALSRLTHIHGTVGSQHAELKPKP